MDKLLNIKEASAFFGVSEMTVRRWTNSGKLKCFRIGGKKERRFRLLDLQEMLNINVHEIPIGFNESSVPKSSHISHFYSKDEDSFGLGMSFVKGGLDRGEVVLIASPDTKIRKLLTSLEDHGVMVEILQSHGILNTMTGIGSLDDIAEMMTTVLDKSKEFRGFRLLNDMAWTIEQGWDLSKAYAFEKLINEMLSGKETRCLCQYETINFSADMSFMALQTHNFTVYKNKFKPNPYFDIAKGWINLLDQSMQYAISEKEK